MASLLLEDPPSDTISDLAFSPDGSMLAASSWDGTCRIWRLNDTYSASTPLFTSKVVAKEAVLKFCWDPSGNSLYYGTSDGQIIICNPQNKQNKEFVKKGTIIGAITGLKFWEASNYLIISTTKGKIYAVDIEDQNPVLVYDGVDISITDIALGGNTLYFIVHPSKRTKDYKPPQNFLFRGNLNELPFDAKKVKEVPRDEKTTPIPITSLATNTAGTDWICGYITGHIEYQMQNDSEPKVEKGHRIETGVPQMFASNCIAMSPERPFAVSFGGEGNGIFINLTSKRTKMSKFDATVTACCFSPTQGVIAYASGNDWSKGALDYFNQMEINPPKISLKKLTQADYV